jgi:hypothetical protein
MERQPANQLPAPSQKKQLSLVLLQRFSLLTVQRVLLLSTLSGIIKKTCHGWLFPQSGYFGVLDFCGTTAA